jgi:RND family efflux transporter MFP subunit
VGGVVEHIRAEEGQYVKRGQPLAQLDDERLRLEMQRADVALKKLSRDLERAQTVYEKQLLSQEEYDRIRSDYETQKAATDLARLELNYTTIRAPISGWVSLRHIKPGNMVQPNEAAFRITDFDPLRAVLHIPERDLAKLAVGQPATLRLDALPNQTFEGTVTLISPVVDPSTGTVKVTVEVQDPSRTAKPGMFGRIQIQHDQRENALLLPKAAVMEEDDRTTVFVVQDSIALRRSITMGYEAGTRVEILSGLQTGDSVVVSGQSVLRDSARVAVIP